MRRIVATAGGALIAAALALSVHAGEETVIVHLGDSITSTIYLEEHEKIAAVLQKRLEKAYPGRAFRNVNLGLDGEWVEAFLKNRYDRVLRKRVARADIFVIRYGTNDAQKGKNPPAFTKDLETLVGRLKKDYPGCTIILGTGPHIARLPWCNKHQYGPNWQAIRDLGRKAALAVADVYKAFEAEHADGRTVLGRGGNPKDMHPNARGVEVTADVLMKVLKGVLSRERR